MRGRRGWLGQSRGGWRGLEAQAEALFPGPSAAGGWALTVRPTGPSGVRHWSPQVGESTQVMVASGDNEETEAQRKLD